MDIFTGLINLKSIKMNRIKSFVLFAVISVTFISNSYSQSNSTYNFLKLDVDSRSSALAGTFVSADNDVNTIYYNPAGLATLTNKQASVGFFKYLLDINSGNAAYSQKYKNLGYFGAGIRFINYGTFDRYDESFNNTGTFTANDLALSLGYANKYKDNFYYGANLKLIYSSIESYNSFATAVDLGFMYRIPEQYFNAGISLLNLGTQLKTYSGTKESLPLDLRIGASKRLEYLPLTFSFSFNNLTVEKDKFLDRFKNITLGGEFVLNEYVNLRFGYNNQLRQNLKTGSSIGIGGFSAGLGFNFQEKYRLDYAFNSMGNIGALHRINLGFSFK